MGYALAFGACIVCKQPFSFNPVRVPSLLIDGRREPVCRSCMRRANILRQQEGKPLLTIHPHAYEGCPEEELE